MPDAALWKSAVPTTFPGKLLTLDDVAYSPAQMAEIHTERVVAAGGTVANDSRLENRYAFFQEERLLGDIRVLAGPSMGAKVTSDRVDNLFSLRGVDFDGITVGGGSKPLMVADGVNPTAVTDISPTRVGGLFRSSSTFALSSDPTKWFLLWEIATPQDTLPALLAFGNLVQATTGYICARISRGDTLTSYQGQRSDYDPAAAASATTRMTANFNTSAYGPTVCIGVAYNISLGLIKLIINGVEVATQTASTGALYNYVEFLRFLYAGGGYDGSANITASVKGKWYEMGAVGDLEEYGQALRIIAAAGAEYA